MNCFADKGSRCRALIEKKCKDCKFAKSNKTFIEDRVNAIMRIRSLDASTQAYIQGKYKLDLEGFSSEEWFNHTIVSILVLMDLVFKLQM